MSTGTNRLTFLDNLRWIMVARVVLFHVCAGYSGMPEFFMESQAGGAVGIARNIIAGLPGMSVLFFVAGFFALPSLLKRGSGDFVRGKLYRLGIPYLLCVFFLAPLMPFLGYYSQSFSGLETDSYWHFWSGMLASGFSLDLVPSVFTTNSQLNPMHFWFLSELLQFLLLFTLVHVLWLRWGAKFTLPSLKTPAAKQGQRVSGMTLLIAAVLMTAVQTPIALLGLEGGLFLGIVHFQPVSWINHGVFFALGIFAYSRGWFTHLKPPGWRALGVLVLAMVGLGVFASTYNIMGDHVPPVVFRLFATLWMTISALWFLVAAIGLAYRYMNKPSTICARLAQVSYPTYLIHYPLILVFRLGLLTTDIPAPAKVFLIFTLVATASVLIGLQMRARPRAAAWALVGMHVVMLTVGLPRTSWSHTLLDRTVELRQVIPAQRPVHVDQAMDLELSALTALEGSLVDSTHTPMQPLHMAADRNGGVFFSAGEGDSSGVYFVDAGTKTPRQVAHLPEARGVTLSHDGRTLYAVAMGDYNVWAFDVGQTGKLSNQRVIAELFRGDGRYDRDDLHRTADAAPEGLTVDVAGRLYVTSRAGLQVFSSAGRLLGVVDFPDVPLQTDRLRPLTVSLAGDDMATLYVSTGAQVFGLTTTIGG
ncbi:MAG: acyltransferase family protein [Gemmatimonadetes bacterium]|nr:acyltransferase family protein [Gemmatimonadota bacterium]